MHFGILSLGDLVLVCVDTVDSPPVTLHVQWPCLPDSDMLLCSMRCSAQRNHWPYSKSWADFCQGYTSCFCSPLPPPLSCHGFFFPFSHQIKHTKRCLNLHAMKIKSISPEELLRLLSFIRLVKRSFLKTCSLLKYYIMQNKRNTCK